MNYLIELSDSVARIVYHQAPKISQRDFYELQQSWDGKTPLDNQPFFTDVKIQRIDFLRDRYDGNKAFYLSPADFKTLENELRNFEALIKPMTGSQVAEYYADF